MLNRDDRSDEDATKCEKHSSLHHGLEQERGISPSDKPRKSAHAGACRYAFQKGNAGRKTDAWKAVDSVGLEKGLDHNSFSSNRLTYLDSSQVQGQSTHKHGDLEHCVQEDTSSRIKSKVPDCWHWH